MKRHLKTILICLLCATSAVYAQVPDFEQEYISIYSLSKNIKQETLAAFDSIGTANHLQAAIHAMLRSEYAKQQGIIALPDTLLDNAIDYLQKTHSDYAATALFLKAEDLCYEQQYEAAMHLYLRSEAITRRISDHILLAHLYFNMGDVFFKQDSFAEAIKKWEQARHYYQIMKHQNGILLSNKKILTAYIASGKTDIAQQQIEEMLRQSASDSLSLYYLYSEKARVLRYKEQYDSAIVYLNKSKKMGLQADSTSLNYQLLYNHYYKDECDSVIHYAQMLIALGVPVRMQKTCYGMLANIASRQGDAVAQAHYLVKRDSCNNVLLAIEQQTPAHVLEQQMKDGEQINKLKQTSIVWGGVALVVLLIYLLYVRKMYKRMEEYKRMRKDMELAKKNIHKYKSQIQALEDSKETETEKNTEQIAQLNIQLENSIATQQQLIAQRRKIMRIATRAINEKIELCAAHLRKGEKYTHEQALRRAYEHEIHLYHAAKLKRWLNMEFNYLGKKLIKAHPSLTERDIQLFALILLQTPHKTVSSLLDILPGSVAKTQLRLAQRLNSETMDDLRDYAEVFVMGGEQ